MIWLQWNLRLMLPPPNGGGIDGSSSTDVTDTFLEVEMLLRIPLNVEPDYLARLVEGWSAETINQRAERQQTHYRDIMRSNTTEGGLPRFDLEALVASDPFWAHLFKIETYQTFV